MLRKLECPSCSASLEVPNSLGIAFCMYCGAKAMVRPESSGPNADTLLGLAEVAVDGENFEEAYRYFTQIVEIMPGSVDAWVGKGISAAMLSIRGSNRLREAETCFGRAWDLSRDDNQPFALAPWNRKMADFACLAGDEIGSLLMDQWHGIIEGIPHQVEQGLITDGQSALNDLKESAAELSEVIEGLCEFIHRWSWRFSPSLDGGMRLTIRLDSVWELLEFAMPKLTDYPPYVRELGARIVEARHGWRERLVNAWRIRLRDKEENPNGTLEEIMPELMRARGGWRPPSIFSG